MAKQMREIKTGEMVMITVGEYSDYQVTGLFKALKDFNPDEIVARFREEKLTAEEREDNWAQQMISRHILFLLELGVVEQVQAAEMHLGSYGGLDPRVTELEISEYL